MQFKFSILFFVLLPSLFFAQDSPKTRGGAVRDTNVYPVAEYTATAQDTTVNGIDYSNPETFFEQGAVGALYAGILSLLAYLGGFIPGLRNIKSNYVKSGAVIFVLLAGLATFKAGVFTSGFFDLIQQTFLPNFAFSGIIYETFKVIMKLIPKKAQAPA